MDVIPPQLGARGPDCDQAFSRGDAPVGESAGQATQARVGRAVHLHLTPGRAACAGHIDGADAGFDQLAGELGADAPAYFLDDDGKPDDGAHLFDPHQPYAAPAPFPNMYDPDGIEGLPTMPALRRREGR